MDAVQKFLNATVGDEKDSTQIWGIQKEILRDRSILTRETMYQTRRLVFINSEIPLIVVFGSAF